ncbi:Chromatin structure-remodeling complex protein [Wickerhamomyces ciferrii]|uniref:Chromatin structure-remodeling complex protein n=1 Tax=Wickerhamomyces ciferrii (strain ATCC 14091 / BCRC 22168 / CBS 111 / JCM 3599 / NBRC 0793 / NRRL Y-1031 F-60-10) TaxID=1206466 RepID=K0KHN4_WICCF|nr:Chromatin structure-remodeling complex protein [Wickerhamomyces ciferrii]CCH40673.1 Chromatin structure-remodeling complex protein [Wickerhamomyces ciferrii]
MSTPEEKEETPDQIEQDQQQNEQQHEQQDHEMNDAEDGTQGTSTPTPHPVEEPIVDYAEESRKIEEKAKTYLARQTKPIIIPSFASWFEFDSIHEIEKKSLPEFFNNNSRFKTSKSYQDIRNFMIHTYRLNPNEYLTVTATRRNIAADVASIIRLHAFLETWGLINYQIDPKTKPSLIGPQYTGHFQIILDTPDGLKPFIPENAKIVNIDQEEAIKVNGGTTSTNHDEPKDINVPINLELRRNVYDSSNDAIALNEQEKLNLNTKQFTCYVTGNDTTDVKYHNLRTKNSISARAFKEGHFGSNFHSSDFIRLENLQNHGDASPWTDQEVLLLLEGVEIFDNDWEKISNHVGSRNKEQCIGKFIQLPIEDRFLSSKDKVLKSQPKDNTNDSVLKTIKFLIKNLDPELASKDLLEKDEDVQKSIKLTLGSLIGSSEFEKTEIKKESSGLIENLVDLEINKLELKLNKLSILEKQLNQEKAELAQQRKDILLDRLSLKKQSVSVRNKLQQATKPNITPEEGVKLSQEALELAIKSPRTIIINQQSSTTNGNEINNELNSNEKQSIEEDDSKLNPISVEIPEKYQFWKL